VLLDPAENDKAFTLLTRLDEDERKRPCLSLRVGDMVLAPDRQGRRSNQRELKRGALNGVTKP